MKIGIANDEAIRLTGVKRPSKGICKARYIGTW